MDRFVDWIFNLNWQTIAGMFLIGWYYSRDIKEGMKGFREELNLFKGELKQQALRTDKLYEMWCETQKEIKQQHKEFSNEMNAMRKEFKDDLKEIHTEIKNLHIDFIYKQKSKKGLKNEQ